MKRRYTILAGVLALSTFIGGCSTSDVQETTASTTVATTIESELFQNDEPVLENKDMASEALAAYYEILDSTPGITGEHFILDDASFGYEDNYRMFGDHFDWFCIHDINEDGIPELIATSIINFRWNQVYVYSYLDGEAVLLENGSVPCEHGSIDQNASASGTYTLFFCDNNHIHSLYVTNIDGELYQEEYAYEIIGAELVAVDACDSTNAIPFDQNSIHNSSENIIYLVEE